MGSISHTSYPISSALPPTTCNPEEILYLPSVPLSQCGPLKPAASLSLVSHSFFQYQLHERGHSCYQKSPSLRYNPDIHRTHKLSFFDAISQTSLPIAAIFHSSKCLSPKPPFLLLLQTSPQLTKAGLCLLWFPLHKNFRHSLSISSKMPLGIMKAEAQ